MSNSVIGLSIDCGDAAELARFWADALGRTVNPEPTAEFAAIDATDPCHGPRLAFHQVPETKTIKNRLHLDLISSEFAAESERLPPHHTHQRGRTERNESPRPGPGGAAVHAQPQRARPRPGGALRSHRRT